MMRSNNKDDGSLSFQWDLPSSSTSDLSEEDSDHSSPTKHQEIIKHARSQSSSFVQSYRHLSYDSSRQSNERRRK